MTRIIDADGHIVEPKSIWEEYAEPEYRARMIQIRRNKSGADELWIDGENRSRPSLPVAASMMPGGLSDIERARKITWDDMLPGGYDPRARIKVMDEEGIDVAVLYPSLWLLYGDLTDPKLAGLPETSPWWTRSRKAPSRHPLPYRSREGPHRQYLQAAAVRSR